MLQRPEAIRPLLEAIPFRPQPHQCTAAHLEAGAQFLHLPNRPKKTAAHYQQFWTEEGSPFLLTSLVQRDKLRVRLTELMGEPVAVELGMRYGNPSTKSAIEALLDAGVSRIVVVPLYPQETKACAGTCLEEFERARRGYGRASRANATGSAHDFALLECAGLSRCACAIGARCVVV